MLIFNNSITLESSAFIKDSSDAILFPKDANLLNSVVSSAYITAGLREVIDIYDK